MIQAADGFLNDHIAATFHAVHYDRLLGQKTPKAEAILARTLRDQKPDGSWMLNPLARDRHAAFDAVFMLKHLGGGKPECRRAIEKAADWALTCRNADGGFGHYPGSPSDWDAVFFQVGVLTMAGRVKPAATSLCRRTRICWAGGICLRNRNRFQRLLARSFCRKRRRLSDGHLRPQTVSN